MPNGIQRYALDPTGENQDNLIIQENKILSNRDLRFLIPTHGPFFSDSVHVYDGVTNRPLVKATANNPGDYTIPMISQEATLRFGQEIADSILITNSAVAASVNVTYQALGGNFQNNISNVVNIFETFLNDNRTIDWLTGVYGKPNEYPPSLHGHYLSDIFGFETMTYMLEQIRQAILISYSPAWDMLIDAIRTNTATKTDIEAGLVNNKLVTLEVLQHASFFYNFNSVGMIPNGVNIKNGKDQYYDVSATNAPSSDRYYWEIQHISTTFADFAYSSGYFDLTNGKGKFMIQPMRIDEPNERTFKIKFFRGGVQRCCIFESQLMTMNAQGRLASDVLFYAMNKLPTDPTLPITAKTYSVSRRMHDAVRC